MSKVTTRVIQPSEWETYRNIRLRALAESPDSFGSTWELESAFTDEQWRSRLEDGAPDLNLPLFAEIEKSPIGLAWGRIEASDRSLAHVYQVWVAPERRGIGVGRKLMEGIIDWAKSETVRTVALTVTCGDSPARRLYESLGFKPKGGLVPLRPGSHLLEQPMKLEIPHITPE